MVIRRGQALMELVAGMFALALVVAALCGFALYTVKSLRIQNQMRVGGVKSATVEVSAFASEYVFGEGTDRLKVNERLAWPQTSVAR